MQVNPLLGLVPVLLLFPVVALLVGAVVNLRKNPPLSGLLALLAAGLAVLVVLLFRGLVTGS